MSNTWRIVTTDPDTGEEHASEAPTRRVARELAQGLKAISPRGL